MITATRSIGQFIGWEAFLIGIALCVLLSLVVFYLSNVNRRTISFIQYLLVQLVILELCDTIWTLYFYPNSSYINHGVAGMYAFFLLPFLNVLSFVVCTRINTKNRN